MDIYKAEEAEKKIQYILIEAVVDELRIYSTVLNIGFHQTATEGNKPNYLWVNIFSDATLAGGNLSPQNFPNNTFFDRRAKLISELYLLLGRKVTSAKIKSSGFLEVHLNDQILTCFHDGNDDAIEEEVWSITSGTPAPYEAHEWSMSLDKVGEIYLKTPDV